MFACVHVHSGPVWMLPDLAAQFSPQMEEAAPGTVIFSVAGLHRLLGPAPQVAAEISRQARSLDLHVSIALAENPDTALLAARSLPDITILKPGEEAEQLGPLPIGILPATPETLGTLQRWGVRTIADLLALPPLGVIERLGEEGGRLQALAEGRGTRPLRVTRAPADYTARTDLDEPVTNLEPLLFVISGMVQEILRRMAQEGNAVSAAMVTMRLEGRRDSEWAVPFPVPAREAKTILKQIQFALEASKPRAGVMSVAMEMMPAPPRTTQHGLFSPNTAEPERLQTLLARLSALIGADSVGSPELLNTYRPDAWRLRQQTLFRAGTVLDPAKTVQLSLRVFRPARPARVRLEGNRPQYIETEEAQGYVAAAAGPWRTTGEWWAETAWARDEWDVALTEGGLYRIFRQHVDGAWFMDAEYD